MKKINAMKTGQQIKQTAQMFGYSASKLGNSLFLSRQTVYKWYSGVNIPRIDDFIALSELFNCQIEDLIVCDIV